MSFVHLHGHSTFSFLEAIGKPGEILQRAKDIGASSIALTDYHGMYGAIKFFQTAKAMNIQPIIGIETGFVLDINSETSPQQIGNIVILAKSNEGYEQLIKLTSYANTEGIQGKPKIDISALKKRNKDIICFFWWPESRIGKMIQAEQSENKIIEILHMIQEAIGKENTYLEIIAQDHNEQPIIQSINEYIMAIHKKEAIPCMVNNIYHYPKEEDKQAREVALAIKDWLKIYDENRRKPKGKFHILSEEEIKTTLKNNNIDDKTIDELIKTNNSIAENIQIDIKLNQTLFPNYETPEDIQTLYQKTKDTLIE